MYTSSFKATLSAVTILVTAFSTFYAHADARFLCMNDNSTPLRKLQLDILSEANDGLFTYAYKPTDQLPALEGKFEVLKTDVTWSHFIFTGKDGNVSVKLSVPAGIDDNSGVYAELSAPPNARNYGWRVWLECNRAR